MPWEKIFALLVFIGFISGALYLGSKITPKAGGG